MLSTSQFTTASSRARSTTSIRKRAQLVSPKISTYQEITPQIYSWSTTDLPKYDGWEKIGYTEQTGGAQARIAQQASQLSISKTIEWVFNATYMTPGGGRFTDHDFHAYLKQQGIQRDGVPATEDRPKRDRKSTRLNSSHVSISYAVFCLKKKKRNTTAQSKKH